MVYSVLHWAYPILGWSVSIAVLLSLYRARLFRTFRFYVSYRIWGLFAYLLLVLTGIFLGYHNDVYGGLYWGLAVLGWALGALAVLEQYDNSLEAYPGLRALFRRVALAVTVVVLVLLAFSLLQERANDDPHQWLNAWFYLIQRSVRFTIAALVVVLILFIRWFCLPISRMLRAIMLALLVISTLDFASGSLCAQIGLGFDRVLMVVEPAVSICVNCFLLRAIWKWGFAKQPARVFVSGTDESRRAVLDRLESIVEALGDKRRTKVEKEEEACAGSRK